MERSPAIPRNMCKCDFAFCLSWWPELFPLIESGCLAAQS
jgi:hypothetical protein